MDTLFERLIQSRKNLLHLLGKITEENSDEILLDTWTAKDILIHITVWDRRRLDILVHTNMGITIPEIRSKEVFDASAIAMYQRFDFLEVQKLYIKTSIMLEEFCRKTYVENTVPNALLVQILEETIEHYSGEHFEEFATITA